MTLTNFSRSFLAEVHAEVKRNYPEIQRIMRAAWVIHTTFGQWEFHGPDNFYTHFRAEDAYHARAKGWEAWMAHKEEAR